ncbi:hypothetical protein QR680_005332 [Steinernema hermaphroditum]|uniref:Secreted protein n=1 Tax=Steinernema hermaphroditum TaxID=289476 RepID=A0AA39HSP3_9BILA|nr:hypothetical protein QR680_005332 [Steinernema hermaphroditum]
MVSVPLAVLLLCATLTQAHLRARSFYPLGAKTEFYVESSKSSPVGVDLGMFGGDGVSDFAEDRKDPRCLFCRVGRGKRFLKF